MKTSLALALLLSCLAGRAYAMQNTRGGGGGGDGVPNQPAQGDDEGTKKCRKALNGFQDVAAKGQDAQDAAGATRSKDQSDLAMQESQHGQLTAKIALDQNAYNNATGNAKNQAKAQLLADQNALLVVDDMIARLKKITDQETQATEAATKIMEEGTKGAQFMGKLCGGDQAAQVRRYRNGNFGGGNQ